MKRTAVLLALVALGAAAPNAAAGARERDPRGAQVDRFAASPSGLSADEAARRAQQQHGGRVLAVRPEGAGFRVKLLKDGEVRTVYIGN